MNLYASSYASVFTAPADLFKKIDDKYSAPSLLLVVILGLTVGLNNFALSGDSLEEVFASIGKMLLLLLMLFLPVIGVFFSTILYAGLLNWVSKIFKPGKVDSTQLRMSFPFTYIPTIIALLVCLFVPSLDAQFYVKLIGWLWSYTLIVIMLSSVRQLTYLKSIAVTLLGALIVALPVLLIYGIIQSVK